MRRRKFILGGAAAAWPLSARAQQSSNKIPVVGVLWHAGSAEEEDVYLSVLVQAFNDLGYVEGKNIHLDHRFPAENPDRFRALAQELVDEKPDVIIGVTNLGALEVKRATSTIPIVVTVASDAVGMGLVESLARPGGNVTGLSLMAIDLGGKRLEMENATFRKWLADQGCHFDTQREKRGEGHGTVTIHREGRTAELPLVGERHNLDPRSVRQVCEALGLDWSNLPGPKGRV